jgi:hypothetical protein
VGDPRGGHGRLPLRRGDLQRPPVGGERRVEASLGPLHLAEVLADPHGQEALADGVQAVDARGQGARGFGQPAAQPLGHAQVPADDRVQRPLALVHLGERAAAEGDLPLGVAVQLGQVRPLQRNGGADVGQQAPGPADRRLERLLARGSRQRALGRLQPVGDLVRPTGDQRRERPCQQQQRPGVDQLGGERRQPSLERGPLAAQRDRVGVPLHQPGGPGRVPGGQGVPDGVVGESVRLRPRGRGAVQLRHPLGPLLRQAHPQQVGEQVVEAPPAADLVQRHQDKVGPLDLLQQRLAVGPPGDRVAQRPRQPLQDRGLQQEPPQVLRLAVQHLLGQEVQHIPVAAGGRRHEPGRVRLAAQRQPGKLQARHPPLGPRGQRRHRRLGQVAPDRAAQQRRRLLGGEAQVALAHLGQPPAGAQPGQRQRRVGAAGHHQLQARWQVLEQELERAVHLVGLDQVVVVQDQHHPVRLGGQLVDQGAHQALERRRRRRPEQRGDLPGHARTHPVQGGDHVPPEPRRVVVALVQRQPADRSPTLPCPVAQQGRLAEPGGRAHQHQLPGRRRLQSVQQAPAGHEPRLQARQMQLGGHQPIPDDTLAGRGACGGFRHGALLDPSRAHCRTAAVLTRLPPSGDDPPGGRAYGGRREHDDGGGAEA